MKKRQRETEIFEKADEKNSEEKEGADTPKENSDDKSGVFLKAILASLCLVIAIMLVPYGRSVMQNGRDSVQTEPLSETIEDKAGAADEDETDASFAGRETDLETETESETESEIETEPVTDSDPESETESGNFLETVKETETAAASESTASLDSSSEPETVQDGTLIETDQSDQSEQMEASSQVDANTPETQNQEQASRTGSVSTQTYNAATLSVTGIPNTLLNYIANRYELQYTLYAYLWDVGYRNNVSASVSDYEIDPDARCATIYFTLSDGNRVTGVYDLDKNAYSYQ